MAVGGEYETDSLSTLLSRVGPLLQSFKWAKWALADQVIVSGSNFLSNILLARILGIEEFGRYVLAWTVVLFVQGLQFSAVSSTMLSIGPKHDAEAARSYFGAIFVHQAIFGMVSAALTLVGAISAAVLFLNGALTPSHYLSPLRSYVRKLRIFFVAIFFRSRAQG